MLVWIGVHWFLTSGCYYYMFSNKKNKKRKNHSTRTYEAFHVNCPSARRPRPKSCHFYLMFMILKCT